MFCPESLNLPRHEVQEFLQAIPFTFVGNCKRGLKFTRPLARLQYVNTLFGTFEPAKVIWTTFANMVTHFFVAIRTYSRLGMSPCLALTTLTAQFLPKGLFKKNMVSLSPQ